jgi:hypothetical protein
LKEGVSAKIREDRPFTISELYEHFAVGYRSTIHKIVKELTVSFSDEGIKKLVQGYDRYLIYMATVWRSSLI